MFYDMDDVMQQMIDMFDQISQMDICDLPNVRMCNLLISKLVDNGFSQADAEKVVAKMDISINEDVIASEKFDILVSKMAEILVKMREYCDVTYETKDFFFALVGATHLKVEE